MESLSGGVLLVVASVLWGVFLLPAILRNRDLWAAERKSRKLHKKVLQLSAAAAQTAEDKLVKDAEDALNRGQIMREKERAERAERRAELVRARTAVRVAQIAARQAEKERLLSLRAAKLKSKAAKRARWIAAVMLLAGVCALLLGAGLAVAGQGGLIAVTGAGVAGVAFVTLVALAPGRAAARVPETREQRVAVATAVAAADSAEAADVAEAELRRQQQAAAERHAARQAAAAEQAERAKAAAQVRARQREKAALRNQTGTIFLVPDTVANASRSASKSSTVSGRNAADATVQQPAVQQPVGVNLDEVLRRRRSAG